MVLIKDTDGFSMFVWTAALIFEAVIRPALSANQSFELAWSRVIFRGCLRQPLYCFHFNFRYVTLDIYTSLAVTSSSYVQSINFSSTYCSGGVVCQCLDFSRNDHCEMESLTIWLLQDHFSTIDENK